MKSVLNKKKMNFRKLFLRESQGYNKRKRVLKKNMNKKEKQ
jgi:hypothetical protein